MLSEAKNDLLYNKHLKCDNKYDLFRNTVI